jgi:hypothetical protein
VNPPYVEEKRSHSITTGKIHARRCLERVNVYWVPYFKGKMLGEITRQDLRGFSKGMPKKLPGAGKKPLVLYQNRRLF